MKKLIVLIVVLAMAGCVTPGAGQKIDVPGEDIVIPLYTPRGTVAVPMPKGYLNPENEGENYVTEREYQERLDAARRKRTF